MNELQQKLKENKLIEVFGAGNVLYLDQQKINFKN